MKYKRQIATGALAFSLMIAGSSLYAASPQDLGIKNIQRTFQKQNKERQILEPRRQSSVVGIVSAINESGFILDVKNLKTKNTSSIDIKTNDTTVYSKNGITAKASVLSLGQKVIASGSMEKTTNILTAKTIKITTKVAGAHRTKKIS